ncbi:DNA internalization-related competence protein ComEC/Rec2 [Aquabacterium sp. A7-Y]|uniref:DNA internalization-related competence protein ComEC/Rec2 n=1 Tax=Aquabacterium sp. A7-Y TaxID=1349605 RepID=UPI00223CB9B3|nr:DNA internalization-related competence protein ComEC/Rec2 [Aquabacterium sp. A7-Y]MCW7538188.1 DNA internalization-related competence protein ComEC/Rec2 [Aquabacterium sp. A7-Y]
MRAQAGSTLFVWLLPLAGLLGAVLQLQQRALWPLAVYAGLAAGALAAAAAGRRSVALAATAAIVVGFGLTGAHAVLRLADRLPPQLEGQDLSVTGLIAGLPQRLSAGQRFRFEVEQAELAARPVALPRTLLLSWYASRFADGTREPVPSEAQPPLKAGQRWRLTVRLKQPHGSFNPEGFDHELWLFEQGVGATGHVREARPAPELLDAAAALPLQRARQRVRDRIEAEVDEPRAAGVLAALVVGDQAAIAREDWQVFRSTGVAHLMAISGLHVTMFAWLASAAVQRAWRWGGQLMLWLPAPHAARWSGLLLAAAYALFSGWGVPAQRTVWMLAVVQLVAASGRRWPWPLVLLWAAAVVALFDPWALLQPGFWLSFSAVALLMASERRGMPGRAWAPGRWSVRRLARGLWSLASGGLRTQVLATLGLAPLSLLFFQQLSVVGLLANLVAIPVLTLVVTPLAMLAVLCAPLWGAAAWSLHRLFGFLEALAGWPQAVWAVAAAPAWAAVAGLVGALVLVLPLPQRLRLLGLPLLLPLLMPGIPRPAPGSFDLIVPDVGQGGAVIVRTAHRTLLYDAGPHYGGEADAGERVLLPLLQALGERAPDRLVLSHRDNDHAGGLPALLRAYPGMELWSSLEPDHPMREQAARHVDCQAGQHWEWDGVRFEMLHPQPGDRAPPLQPNQVSCVLKISGAGYSALLTGDIERGQETLLVAWQREALRADLLLAPHHGSKTSSTAAFLDAVQPRTAVFQAGYRNRFGHPAAAVLARYQVRGIERITSAQCGAYRWAEGRGQCERDRRRRYWHHRGSSGDVE